MNQTKSRYPGVRPFDIYDSNRFFGRDEELARLCENIEFEKLLILHGKSGYGKSSIIKAGVIPNFSNKGKSNSFKTIYLSLKEKNDDPVNLISNHPSLKAIPIDNNFSEIEKIGLTQNLLWWEFKKRQNSADKYCLFLDQFEDFFSIDYSDQKRKDFARSLADLLYIDNPPELRKKWKDLPQNIKGYTIKPLEIKIIIIIRSDKISELDFFKPILGDKINRRFELGPLKRDQAIKAIVKPARLQDPSFNSPPFEYAESGINKIMEELTKSSNSRKINNEEIEAFQLQIICEHIENKVRNEEIRDIDGNGLPDITESEIPDMKDLYENYYKIKLDLIPDNLRKDAQILIEEKLVAEDAESGIGIRKSVDKLDLNKYGEGLLDTLEDAYLIRREKNTLGGYNYELCHDTLIAPVLKVKKERQLEEIKKREKAERLKSEEELRIANERAKQAEKQAQETDRLRRIAEDAKKQAETSLKKAEKLTDAFYFYKDKYAVAFKENKFYFIDKDGEEYTELGRWDKAEQFDEDIGFAKVTIDKQKAGLALGADNFLDTSENNETTSKQTVDGDLALNQSTVSIIDQNAGLFIGANDSSNTPENRELASKPSVDGYSTLSQSIINSKRQREKQTIEYLINEEGNRYQVCYELHDLNEDIKAIDLRGKQFDTFPTEIFRFPQLQVLIISGKDGRENNFETIPDEIDKLVDLVHIFMDFCKIKKFPKVYGPTKKLLCLSLMNNLIEEVPDDFYCTSNLLKFLNLNNNALSTISGYVSKLDNLEILGLGGNSLNEVSDELWKLKNLKTLALWQTNLQHIPSNIGNLSVLENLYLHNNNIENIPEELYCLTNLVELDLSLNKISTISSSVGKLSKLQILYLYDNQNLSELPEAIYDLEELLELNLTRTNLTFISEAICKLKNLKSLALGGNQITSIPKKLWNLEKIKELYLGGNKITKISSKIKNFSKLTQLSLGFNPISSVPIEIFDLIKLRGLELQNLKLSKISDAICKLKNLESLSLQNNDLTLLPDKIGDLINLTEIYLNDNLLKTLPQSMQSLSKIKELSLYNNKLAEVPVGIFNSLYITHVDFCNNNLTFIPDSVFNLKNLYNLNLSNNLIKAIPSDICKLTRLQTINLDDNQIVTVSNTIFKLSFLTEIHINNNNLNKNHILHLWAEFSLKILSDSFNFAKRFEFIINELLNEFEKEFNRPKKISKIRRYFNAFGHDYQYFPLQIRYLDALIKFCDWYGALKQIRNINSLYSANLVVHEKINLAIKEMFSVILSEKYSFQYQKRRYISLIDSILSSNESTEPVSFVSEVWWNEMITNYIHYWKLRDFLLMMSKFSWQNVIINSDVLDNGLSQSCGLLIPSFTESQSKPITQLPIEFGSTIVHRIDPNNEKSEAGKFLYKNIPAMRNRLLADFSFTAPPVRARSSGLLPYDYQILFDEVPIVRKTIFNDGVFCLLSEGSLRNHGITETFAFPGFYIGEQGTIVSWQDIEILEREKLECLEDIEYIAHDIEVVLRRNLSYFMGIDEVRRLIEESGHQQEFEDFLTDSRSNVLFARLLRTLVKENTLFPGKSLISDLSGIIAIIKNSGGLSVENMPELIRQIRLLNKATLSGNRSEVKQVFVPVEIEEVIGSFFREVQGKLVFTPFPDKAMDVINSIKSIISSPNRNTVLIVRNYKYRPYLRRLLEYRFSDLMVMSEEELEKVPGGLVEMTPSYL